MAKNNRTCICCSKEYEYCNHCKSHLNYPSWMALFHNENCHDIYNITNNYHFGNITKEEAKNGFDQCDLSYKNSLRPSIIKIIDEVYENLNQDIDKSDNENKINFDVIKDIQVEENQGDIEQSIQEKKPNKISSKRKSSNLKSNNFKLNTNIE